MKRPNISTKVKIFTSVMLLASCARASFKVAGEKPQVGDLAAVVNPGGQDALGQSQGPAVTVRANGSEQNIVVAMDTEVEIDWNSKGATDCVAARNDQPIGIGTSGATKVVVSEPSKVIVICQTASGPISDEIQIAIQGSAQDQNQNSGNPSGSTPADGDTLKSSGLKATLKLNGLEESIEVSYGSNVEVSWNSIGALNCTLDPKGIDKTEGNVIFEKVSTLINVSLSCKNATDSIKIQRTIAVTPPGPPVVDLKINGSQGPVVAPQGTMLKVSWVTMLADSCQLSVTGAPAMSVSVQGEIERSASQQISIYQLKCDGPGGSQTDTVLVAPDMSPPTVIITAQGQRSLVEVQPDSMVKIEWVSQNATRCLITPGQLSGTFGNQIVGPISVRTKYTALCEGPFGLGSDSVVIAPKSTKLELALLVNGSSNAVKVEKNSTVKVSWTSMNATSCQVSPFGFSGLNGSDMLSSPLQQNTKITLTCTDSQNLSSTVSIDVTVMDPTVPPNGLAKIDVKVNGSDGPLYVDVNKVVQIVWTSENVTDCRLNSSATTTSGTKDLTITQDTKVILTCKGYSTELSDEVVILVRKQGVAACKVGINIKDGGQWGHDYDPILGHKNPNCFHGVSVCAISGHFKVFGQEVQSLTDQKVGLKITKISKCDHNVNIHIKNPSTTSVAYQSSYKEIFYVHLKKGQTIEVSLANTRLCKDTMTRVSLDKQWTVVTPNQCLR